MEVEGFPHPNLLAPLFAADTFLDATIHAIGLWLLAVLLMALNYRLYRLLEGYDFKWLRDRLSLGPEEIIGSRERHRYRKLVTEKNELDKSYNLLKWHKQLKSELEELKSELEELRGELRELKGELDSIERNRFGKLIAYQEARGSQEKVQETLDRTLQELEKQMQELQKQVDEEQPRYDEVVVRLAEEFPDEPEYVLPTKFGNRIRAFEVYSRMAYGLDLIQGWERLTDVIPNEYQSRISELKAITDFWVNVGVLSLLSAFLYVGMTLYGMYAVDDYNFNFWTLLFPVATLIVAMLTPKAALTAAGQWGETIKAAVDTYLPDLAKKLGFPTEVPQQNNKALWTLFSQSIQGRSEDAMHELERRLEEIKKLQRELEKAHDENDNDKAEEVRQSIRELSHG
jgi:prefoldin subunit 5